MATRVNRASTHDSKQSGKARYSHGERISCPVLLKDGEMPRRYTADGENVSPPINWTVAASAEEYVLVCEDVDSVMDRPFVHWLVYRIPANTTELPAAVSPGEQVDSIPGALQGKNSLGNLGYQGPAPTPRTGWHHYRFRLYSLKAALNVGPGLNWQELFELMKNHIIEVTEFSARYERNPLKGAA